MARIRSARSYSFKQTICAATLNCKINLWTYLPGHEEISDRFHVLQLSSLGINPNQEENAKEPENWLFKLLRPNESISFHRRGAAPATVFTIPVY